jgi:ribosome maturation factor RimP
MGPAVVVRPAGSRHPQTVHDQHEGITMSGTRSSGRREDIPAQLVAAVRPIAEDQGLDLVDVEVTGPPNRRVVRLVADADGGLDVDRIAALSRAVGDVVDDLVPTSYTLEVTSPGTDRPLTTARDFQRNHGRDVRVQRDGVDDVTGQVVDVAADAVHLDVDGDVVVVTLADITDARVVLPW